MAALSLLTSILVASTTTSLTVTSTGAASSTIISGAVSSSIPTASIGTISGSVLTNATSKTHSSIHAQTTTSLFNACAGPSDSCSGISSLTYYGAVVTANPTQVIYALGCASGDQLRKNQTQCWDSAITVTAGPSMFQRVESAGKVPVTVSCSIEGKTKGAVCVEQSTMTASNRAFGTGTVAAVATGNVGNKTVSTKTLRFNGTEVYYNNLVITKGAEKLTATETMATRTPLPPSPPTSSPSPSKTSGAGNTVSASLTAAVLGLVFAVFAL